MNNNYKMFWKCQNFERKSFLALSLTACVLSACGGDSVVNKDATDDSKEAQLSYVETFDDLPNCSKSRQDSVMQVQDENLAYGCFDNRWRALGELYEKEDDLPNCSDNRDGLIAYLLDVNEMVFCSDGSWEVAPDDVSMKSSSSRKGSIRSNASMDDDEEDFDEEEGMSSSSKKNKSSSSRAAIIVASSSSRLIISSASTSGFSRTELMTACGVVPYTTRTAGPRGYWGDFGYVLPLKITTTSTQKLYVAFDTVQTFINSGMDWRNYSVLIALFDPDENRWIPGTEIFSNDLKDATTINGYQHSTVNTYGMFDMFTFKVRGTWLENYAGRTVDVVVNFYAYGIPSDSSGTGLDFYAIPLEHPKMYYSETALDCFLPVKGVSDFPPLSGYSSCNISRRSQTVYQGDTVVWTIPTVYRGLVNKPWFSMSLETGEIVKMAYGGSEDEMSQYVSAVYAVYPSAGQFTESLKISALPGVEYECSAFGDGAYSIEILPRSVVPSNKVGCMKAGICTEGPASMASECTAEEGEELLDACPAGGEICDIDEEGFAMYFEGLTMYFYADAAMSCDEYKALIAAFSGLGQ